MLILAWLERLRGGLRLGSDTGELHSHSTSQVLLRNLDQASQKPFSVQFWDPNECYCASCKLTLPRVLFFPWEMGICALHSQVTAEASLLEQGEKQEKEAQLMSWLEPAEATAVCLKITPGWGLWCGLHSQACSSLQSVFFSLLCGVISWLQDPQACCKALGQSHAFCSLQRGDVSVCSPPFLAPKLSSITRQTIRNHC